MADTNHTSSQNPIMVLCGRAFSAEAVSIIEFTGRLVKYSANPASRLKICLSDYKTTARAKVERKTILNTHLTLFYHCFYQMTGDYAKNRTERRGKKMQNAFKVFKFFTIKMSCQLQTSWVAQRGFPGGSVVKNPLANEGDSGWIPGWERSPEEGNGNPLQYCCLENPMEREAWWATVHDVAESGPLSNFTYL